VILQCAVGVAREEHVDIALALASTGLGFVLLYAESMIDEASDVLWCAHTLLLV
jgi:pyrroline-5-carboxylate reductase